MKNKLIMPIVKWVGGKRQLIPELESRLPKKINTYFEPFFGGGALLFHLQPKSAVINDVNMGLISMYQIVKNESNSLIDDLKKHQNTSEYFYKMRDMDRNKDIFAKLTEVEKASRLIFLNKTCFNGLYRVNSSGEFNTPFGGYKQPNIVNESTIRAVSDYFNKNSIKFLNLDFEESLEGIKKGDFVYFDPPYDPISINSNFTGYNESGFTKKDQERLRDLCVKLDKMGINFMLSNSATDYVKDLYKNFVSVEIVKARRSINSDGNGRGEIDEVIVRNYKNE